MTLGANYKGARRLQELAARMPQLRALVHLSTCYVNINQPPGARVQERCVVASAAPPSGT